ncbi:MAG: hypothetical protein LC780_07255 [Acidobacteria bacterium]|nr:hypothetical protein [Acidobacteriota bacterium]
MEPKLRRARGMMVAGILLAAALAAAQEATPAEPSAPRIGEIRVQALDVYSPEEAARGWVYRTANAVRFETRESVIRKFLLFHEGDALDATRLEETERNLRALPFLKAASVRALPAHDGVADVEVVTQDSWTTQPGLSFGGKGGVTTYGFDLQEKDFLGTGRQIALGYDKGAERTNRVIEYTDPYLFGPYWKGDFAYSSNSDGSETRAFVGRPFVSFVDRWAADGLFDRLTLNARIFADGEVLSRYRQRHQEVMAHYGLALEATDARARRVFLRFHGYDDRFELLATSPSAALPSDRRFRFVTVGYEDVRNAYLKLNYINRDSRYEDFNLGRRVVAEVGVSPSGLGGARTTGLVRLNFSQGWRIADESFLTARVSYRTRWDGAPASEIVSGSVFFAHKFEGALPGTFVTALVFDRGWNLDRDVQFFADGQNGLRGYRLYAFEGDKRIVWNAEQRLFTGREVLQLFSPGAAIFFDTGAATPPGQPLRLADFKTDVGIGLRIAITRASTNSILRFDLAYALNRDPRGRRGFLVSFSSGQGF